MGRKRTTLECAKCSTTTSPHCGCKFPPGSKRLRYALRLKPLLKFKLFRLLPAELQLKTFQFLSARDLCSCALVCRSFNSLSKEEFLWKRLCLRKADYFVGVPRLPHGLATWRSYFPSIHVDNELKQLGVELLDSVVLTSEYRWHKVSFCLSSAEDGSLFPTYKLVVAAEGEDSPQSLGERNFKNCTEMLGVQQGMRSTFFASLFNEMSHILEDNNISWDGQIASFKHKQGTDLSSIVQLTFSNLVDSEEGKCEENVYTVDIDPVHGVINEGLLQKVLERNNRIGCHDAKLRELLRAKRFVSTDINKCLLLLEDVPGDSSPIIVPFQVIGSHSPTYNTWCWSWHNDSYNEKQREEIVDLKERSQQEKWPESNLFNTSLLDCEPMFGFAIAHLVVGRLHPLALVYPVVFPNHGPRIFLALKLHEMQGNPELISNLLGEPTQASSSFLPSLELVV